MSEISYFIGHCGWPIGTLIYVRGDERSFRPFGLCTLADTDREKERGRERERERESLLIQLCNITTVQRAKCNGIYSA